VTGLILVALEVRQANHIAKAQMVLDLAHAGEARKSSNRNHALAGLWLQVLNHADQGNSTLTQDLLAEVVEKDWDIDCLSQARAVTSKSLRGLEDIRGMYGLPRKLPGAFKMRDVISISLGIVCSTDWGASQLAMELPKEQPTTCVRVPYR
jgi:hypothetical protein